MVWLCCADTASAQLVRLTKILTSSGHFCFLILWDKESYTNHLINFRPQWSPSELSVWASFTDSQQIETLLRHNHSGYAGEAVRSSSKFPLKKPEIFSFDISKRDALNSSVNIVIDALKEKEKITSS